MVKRVVMAIALAAFAAGCARVERPAEGQATIRAYIVHHAVPAFKSLISEFERESGIRVQASFACRGGKLVPMTLAGGDGDVFITDSLENVSELKAKGVCRSEPVRLGQVTPVIQVVKGNPKGIKSLADLARPGVKVVLCHEKGCLGRVTDRILAASKLAEKIKPNIVERIRGETATAKAVDGVKADAAIMWSWVIFELGADRYEMIPIPPEVNVVEPLVAVLLTTGKNPEGAEKFVQFLRSEKAKRALARAGLRATDR